ncbi:hypothetical protein HG535_0D03420 [Zygotorulaspora mrakii]|uniref:Uncharacterized protein n=1 Tax=Zygotorulaspora mrakii TaxID=42260 RepID=A0A7H9B2M4_ZYGMR|nr:uncharacterized protein HG535_0D03420 [Zygotorulaspora mrakii]QLG72634.1 hypothetical protein HG535_0D03420 [Zygotorulaspora mrakii]
MNQYLKLLTNQLGKLPRRVLQDSMRISSKNSGSELEHVFEQISNVLENNESYLVTKVDKFSQETARLLVKLLESHFVFINYIVLTLIATLLVMYGTFASIDSIPYTALPPTKLHPLFDPSDFDLEQDCEIVYADTEDKKTDLLHLDEKQAILLPLRSGAILLVLYFIVTKLELQWKLYLLKFLNFIMILMSVPASFFVYNYVANTITRHISHWISCNPLKICSRVRITISDDNEEITRSGCFVQNFSYRDVLTNELGFKDTVDKLNKEDSHLKRLYSREFTKPKEVKSNRQMANIYANGTTAISLILSIMLSACYFFCPNDWLVRNVVSINFALWTISQLKLKNLKSGALILFALFLYDIYFVFGTNVMVTVATNLDLPIKLSLPTNFNVAQGKFEFSMLGLGDIVLPGSFISLCYKYDIWKWHYENNDIEFHLLNWSYVGRYFITSMISYLLALGTCMFALAKYKVAQPALLYIVPFLLISTIFTAWIQGDLAQFWTFQYDVIELGENKLSTEHDDSDSNTDAKEYPVTYSDFFQSDCIENDDDDEEENYTYNDALIDYESDDDLDYDSEVNEDDFEIAVPEYKPTDILRLLDDAAHSPEGEDADFVLDDDGPDLDSETDTVILDADEL